MNSATKLLAIGDAIHKIRMDHQLSMRQFAKLIDCDIVKLSTLETARTEPEDFLPCLVNPNEDIDKYVELAQKLAIESNERLNKMQKILEE